MSRATLERAPGNETITWTSGTSSGPASSATRISKAEALGFVTSTAFSSSEVTFQVASSSGGTWYDLYLGSSQVALTVSTAAARAILLDVDRHVFAPWDWMRVVSSSTGEAAARTWTIWQA